MPVVLYKRQRQILEFIANFIKKYGYSPTLGEICKAMGVTSPATIYEHMTILERKGLIRKTKGKMRGIEIVTDMLNLDSSPELPEDLPLLGFIAAGKPLEPYTDPTATFKIPSTLIPSGKSAYVLQVKGNSMIEDGIFDGDFVVIVKQEIARDGEIVVALLENGLATLKRIFRENGRVKLMPANAKMEPIYANDVQVQGKMVALIRKYG